MTRVDRIEDQAAERGLRYVRAGARLHVLARDDAALVAACDRVWRVAMADDAAPWAAEFEFATLTDCERWLAELTPRALGRMIGDQE